MDAVELRYSSDAKLRDVLVCLALALVLGTALAPLLGRFVPMQAEPPGLVGLLAVYAGCWIPGVLVAGIWRWGMRGRVDADGASVALSGRGPVEGIGWSEVREVFALRPMGFELRGDGSRVKLSADFDGLGAAWVIVGRRRAALQSELLAAFEGGATLRFRGPMAPREAAASGALLAFFFMPAILIPLGFAAFRLPAARMLGASVAAVAGAVWLSLILGFALAARARACGWVEVGPDGLLGRPAWRTRRCRWEDLASVERAVGGRLLLRGRGASPIRIDATIANVDALERILRSRIEGAPR